MELRWAALEYLVVITSMGTTVRRVVSTELLDVLSAVVSMVGEILEEDKLERGLKNHAQNMDLGSLRAGAGWSSVADAKVVEVSLTMACIRQ